MHTQVIVLGSSTQGKTLLLTASYFFNLFHILSDARTWNKYKRGKV